MTTGSERSKLVETSDTLEAIEECFRLGWSDGLPVIPPVDYKVREMLEHARHDRRRRNCFPWRCGTGC